MVYSNQLAPEVQPQVSQLAARWWALTIRGLAAVAFGVLCWLAPRTGLVVLVALFGAYALLDGVFSLVLAARGARTGARWGWFLLGGAVSIGAAAVTFLWPGITAVALLTLIAVWAFVAGVVAIAAAVRLRHEIKDEWLLGLSGVLSIAFSVLMFTYPKAGALAVVLWIGGYAVLFGILLMALSFRLRAWHRSRQKTFPPSSVPSAA